MRVLPLNRDQRRVQLGAFLLHRKEYVAPKGSVNPMILKNSSHQAKKCYTFLLITCVRQQACFVRIFASGRKQMINAPSVAVERGSNQLKRGTNELVKKTHGGGAALLSPYSSTSNNRIPNTTDAWHDRQVSFFLSRPTRERSLA
jgi:hypothetical protein